MSQNATATAEVLPIRNDAAAAAERFGEIATKTADEVSALVISTDEQALCADSMLRNIIARSKELDDRRKALTRPLDEAKKGIMDLFRGPLEVLDKAGRSLKVKLAGYQEAKAEAARKAAEEERRRIERNAAKRAERLEAKGDAEAADAVRMEAEMEAHAAATTIAEAPAVKTSVSARDNWKAELVDIKALAKAVADGRAPATLLCFSSKDGNAYARATKGTVPVDGVRFYNDRVLSSR